MENDYGRNIVRKLEQNQELNESEKSYVEKAVLLVDYYEHLLNQNLGIESNTIGLKFQIKGVRENGQHNSNSM